MMRYAVVLKVAVGLGKSVLASYLVTLWSWGMISPQLLQSIMGKAAADMEAHKLGKLDFDEVSRLAGIGGAGSSSQNAMRDLQNHMKDPPMSKCRFSLIAA